MKRSQVLRKPYRVKRKKSIFRNRFFWIFVLLLIFIGTFFYLIIFSPPFQIKALEISGNQKVKKEDIGNIVEKEIQKKILFFLTKSIFLVNSGTISKSLMEKFPEISRVNLKRQFPDVLIAEIEERTPIALFCQEEDCFYLDKEGIIFEKSAPGDKLTIVKSEMEKIEPYLGMKALEDVYVKAILEIQKRLKDEVKMEIQEFTILSQERLNAKTSGGWDIYFNPKTDVSEQIFNLVLVLEEKIPPERMGDLKYIDLRFGNRVYVSPEGLIQSM